ncbi:hypothetical protein [Desulfuromonas sp. CSMB_57]|uniref:hypothetical protein n=1 Tax=Desulfuromonas sp. CSMB_57 TaxID=2807629 RepID=UPI001CD345BB|nr:hypothetical protein [Desulfuromonas sp. CSMB_57]
MPLYRDVISDLTVDLPRRDLRTMLRTVRTLFRLSGLPAYRATVLPLVPESARFDPGHDAVMMGYDFHLTADGPRLIEVNTNAGGGLLAALAHFPSLQDARRATGRLRRAFLEPFAAEMARFSGGALARPRRVVILDEEPETQFLYAEMQAFAELFQEWGTAAQVVDPVRLHADGGGVWLDGERIDLIYNRHCDFYLESAAMAGIRAAYLTGEVCLSPNPFVYGLLGDKRRMVLWSDVEILAQLGLSQTEQELLLQVVPRSRLLADLAANELWPQRKSLVFKPVDRYGSRGVLVGDKLTRGRFEALPADQTLVQDLVPPSLTPGGSHGEPMKTDLRLYAYRDQVLGLGARLYRGQVTNLRTPGGGFARVRVV